MSIILKVRCKNTHPVSAFCSHAICRIKMESELTNTFTFTVTPCPSSSLHLHNISHMLLKLLKFLTQSANEHLSWHEETGLKTTTYYISSYIISSLCLNHIKENNYSAFISVMFYFTELQGTKTLLTISSFMFVRIWKFLQDRRPSETFSSRLHPVTKLFWLYRNLFSDSSFHL